MSTSDRMRDLLGVGTLMSFIDQKALLASPAARIHSLRVINQLRLMPQHPTLEEQNNLSIALAQCSVLSINNLLLKRQLYTYHWKHLGQALSKNQNLTALEIKECVFGDEDFEVLIGPLERHPNLKYLDLRANCFTNPTKIVRLLTCSKLDYLDLSANPLDLFGRKKVAMKDLAFALKNNTYLKVLKLNSFDAYEPYLLELIKAAFENSTLEEFDLRSGYISTSCVKRENLLKVIEAIFSVQRPVRIPLSILIESDPKFSKINRLSYDVCLAHAKTIRARSYASAQALNPLPKDIARIVAGYLEYNNADFEAGLLNHDQPAPPQAVVPPPLPESNESKFKKGLNKSVLVIQGLLSVAIVCCCIWAALLISEPAILLICLAATYFRVLSFYQEYKKYKAQEKVENFDLNLSFDVESPPAVVLGTSTAPALTVNPQGIPLIAESQTATQSEVSATVPGACP